MNTEVWKPVLTVHDSLSAQALAERLSSEGVPVRVQADTALLGAARRCRILVPARLMHRARMVLEQERFTDEELTFLATGESDSRPPE